MSKDELKALESMHPILHTCNRAILVMRSSENGYNEMKSPGNSSEGDSCEKNIVAIRSMVDQGDASISKITSNGSNDDTISRYNNQPDSLRLRWDQPLSVCTDLKDLLMGMLHLDPSRRLTAWRGLQCNFFEPLERSGHSWALALGSLPPPGSTTISK